MRLVADAPPASVRATCATGAEMYNPKFMRSFRVCLPLVILLACVAGCGSDGEGLRVTSIQLGRSLNADETVGGHTTTFRPRDTVYLSVVTAGSGAGTLGVRWTFAGRVLGEPKKQVAHRDVAATGFELRSAVGFPPGDYTAEVFLDGQPAGTRDFRVEKPR